VGSLVFIDTSILTNFFDVPNKNSDRATVVKEFEQRRQAGATFVLPVTSIIETGNHIAQLNGNARRRAWHRRSYDSGRSGRLTPSGSERYFDRDLDPGRAFGFSGVRPPDPYPRTPYLWRSDGKADNIVPEAERPSWFGVPVLVEEKLDGANVSIWLADGRIQVAPRGGAGAMDRAGQLGRLRSWVSEHDAQLRPLLGRFAVYAEWLWLEHSIEYDQLPDWLVVLDLWRPDSGMVQTTVRDEVVAETGLLLPPRLYTGVLAAAASIDPLIGPSTWGSEVSEGVVLRRMGDDARAKVVRADYRRKTDEEWTTRSRNRRVGKEAQRREPR
jgi:hypothetical protein